MFSLWLSGQHGVMARGVETEDDFGAWRPFDAQALGADGHAAIGADPQGGAQAPNIRPPRTSGCRTEHGSFFLFGEFPGSLRGQAQFAVGFVGVTMEP